MPTVPVYVGSLRDSAARTTGRATRVSATNLVRDDPSAIPRRPAGPSQPVTGDAAPMAVVPQARAIWRAPLSNDVCDDEAERETRPGGDREQPNLGATPLLVV